jgi:hypothetical protein
VVVADGRTLDVGVEVDLDTVAVVAAEEDAKLRYAEGEEAAFVGAVGAVADPH